MYKYKTLMCVLVYMFIACSCIFMYLGIYCIGDYCQAHGFHMSKGTGAGTGTGATDPSKGRPLSASTKKVSVPSSSYQLAFKSILLDRAESKLLGPAGLTLREDTSRDLDRHSGDVDRILYTFARSQIQRVASTIRTEVRGITFNSNSNQRWDDLSFLYHKLVYNEALSSVHPSRFYQTAPVCEMCSKVYRFLEFEREETFMRANSNSSSIVRVGAGRGSSAPSTARAPLIYVGKIRPKSGGHKSISKRDEMRLFDTDDQSQLLGEKICDKMTKKISQKMVDTKANNFDVNNNNFYDLNDDYDVFVDKHIKSVRQGSGMHFLFTSFMNTYLCKYK
jgi:hypothetical protein